MKPQQPQSDTAASEAQSRTPANKSHASSASAHSAIDSDESPSPGSSVNSSGSGLSSNSTSNRNVNLHIHSAADSFLTDTLYRRISLDSSCNSQRDSDSSTSSAADYTVDAGLSLSCNACNSKSSSAAIANGRNQSLNQLSSAQSAQTQNRPKTATTALTSLPYLSTFQQDEDHQDYDSDDDSCDSWYHTPFQVATSVKRRVQLHSGQSARFIDPNCPTEDLVNDSGTILIKLKKRFFGHKFVEHFWIRYGRNCLLFFKSRTDAHEWIHNAQLKTEERNSLVQLCIDFEKDSVSDNIMGYKSTCTYYKSYRGYDDEL